MIQFGQTNIILIYWGTHAAFLSILYIYTQKLQIMVVYFIVTFSIFSAMSELIGEKSPDSFTLETYLGQVCGNLNTQSCIGTRTHDHINRIRLVSPRQTPFVLAPPMLAHDEILILDFQVYCYLVFEQKHHSFFLQ